MGLDYSFDMWVPRDALYAFLSRVAEEDSHSELGRLVWPDGRRLEFQTPATESKLAADLPVFAANHVAFCFSLCIPIDQALRIYGLENGSAPLERGCVQVGCVYLRIGRSGRTSIPSWFDEENVPQLVTFTAATTSMSLLFEQSDAVRAYFANLARESGACFCGLNKEDDGLEIIFVADAEFPWISRVLDAGLEDSLLNYGGSLGDDTARGLAFWRLLEGVPRDRIRADIAGQRQHSEAQMREGAYRVSSFLCWQVDEEVVLGELKALEIGMEDTAWRVREAAVREIGNLRIPFSSERLPHAIEPLLRALQDPHIQVRTTAALQLSNFEDPAVMEALRAAITKFSNDSACRELCKHALRGLAINMTAAREHDLLGEAAVKTVRKHYRRDGHFTSDLARVVTELWIEVRPTA